MARSRHVSTVTRHAGSARVLMMGPPAAGKGTQCAWLARHLSVAHVSTGELFREAVARGTPIGRAASRYLDRGMLVPDRLVLRMVHDRIRELGAVGRTVGFLLDGIPRTIRQAEALSALTAVEPVDVVIHLDLPLDVAVARLQARGRSDDGGAAVHQRMSAYERLTIPTIAWLELRCPVLRIHADQPVEHVTHDILHALDAVGVGDDKVPA